MTVSNELSDRQLADYKKPGDLIGENGPFKTTGRANQPFNEDKEKLSHLELWIH